MDQRHLTLPGLKNRKPQYVLGTENGAVRTSNVTEDKIREAVFDIEDHVSVYLEKCVPVVLVRHAEAYSIDYFKDGSIAVCFRVNGCLLRMWRPDVDCDSAADILCAFFLSAALPDMTDWHTQKLYAEEEKTAEAKLTVDDEDFKYFDIADVVCALEKIIDGKSRNMLYTFAKENGGYINIMSTACGRPQASAYKVEYVRWTEQNPIGYRATVSDVDSLRRLLWELIDGDRLPEPPAESERFDVNDYFEKLIFRFLNEEDK